MNRKKKRKLPRVDSDMKIDDEILIFNTTNRLPSNVKKRITKKCKFVDLGKIEGLSLYKPKFIYIILNFTVMETKKFSEQHKMTVIAHEIAHVYLKHAYSTTKSKMIRQENEANALIEKWGYKNERLSK